MAMAMAMAVALDIVRGPAESAISVIIAHLMQQLDDVIHLDNNRRLLQEQLNRMKGLLGDVSYQFDNQQQSPPESLKNCLQRMEGAVRKARELIESSQRPHRCLRIYWAFPLNFRLSRQIREWKTNINGLFDELRTDFSVLCSAQQIAFFTARQAEVQIGKWLTEAPHVRRIGVYGTSGVGKTTLPRKIYSAHKERRTVLKLLAFEDEKSKIRVMKCIACVEGVESIAVDVQEMKIIVIGSADPVHVTVRVRKIGFSAQLLSVGPAQENKFRRSEYKSMLRVRSLNSHDFHPPRSQTSVQ